MKIAKICRLSTFNYHQFLYQFLKLFLVVLFIFLSRGPLKLVFLDYKFFFVVGNCVTLNCFRKQDTPIQSFALVKSCDPSKQLPEELQCMVTEYNDFHSMWVAKVISMCNNTRGSSTPSSNGPSSNNGANSGLSHSHSVGEGKQY